MSQIELGGEDLAEQALSNLVNQFARPMDFLRELVQNSHRRRQPAARRRVARVQAHPEGKDA